MKELLKVNEEYLAKLKYDATSEYFGLSMASILGSIFAKCESIDGSLFCDFYKKFNYRHIGSNYLEIRFIDYSILIFKVCCNDGRIESRSLSFNVDELDFIFSGWR